MSVSGDLPSIGALTVGEKCPDRSGETLVKCLQGSRASSPDQLLSRAALVASTLQALSGGALVCERNRFGLEKFVSVPDSQPLQAVQLPVGLPRCVRWICVRNYQAHLTRILP